MANRRTSSLTGMSKSIEFTSDEDRNQKRYASQKEQLHFGNEVFSRESLKASEPFICYSSVNKSKIVENRKTFS